VQGRRVNDHAVVQVGPIRQGIQTVTLYVSDQDRAKAFYTQRLGFAERMDAPMGPDNRWIELAPGSGETSLVLMKPTEGMPGLDLAKLMIGSWATFIFAVDDINATYRDLTARGVEFQEAPSQQDWGWWATIKDPDGNVIGLHSS
jgi:predicted enzyme related to lactoylglutathione lyase